jgi:hypothetical protein
MPALPPWKQDCMVWLLSGIYVVFVQNVPLIRTNTQCKIASN